MFYFMSPNQINCCYEATHYPGAFVKKMSYGPYFFPNRKNLQTLVSFNSGIEESSFNVILSR